MNLAKPNKLVKYLTDGKTLWILYSHSGWENTIMAEMNLATRRITKIISGIEMKNRDKIAKLEFSDSIKKVSVETGHISYVISADSALMNFVKDNPENELGKLLLMHCDSENIIIDTEALSSDFTRALKGDETTELLEIFRKVNLKNAYPEECVCGVCCDLDIRIKELEEEGLINPITHGKAIGVITDTFDDAVKATEILNGKGYTVMPMQEYPDRYRSFVTYIMKK